MRKSMPKTKSTKMGEDMHKMPRTGMVMSDAEMKRMMTPNKKRGGKVKKGY